MPAGSTDPPGNFIFKPLWKLASPQVQPKERQATQQCDIQTDAHYDAVIVVLPGCDNMDALLACSSWDRLKIPNRRIDFVIIQLFDIPVWLGVLQHKTFLI